MLGDKMKCADLFQRTGDVIYPMCCLYVFQNLVQVTIEENLRIVHTMHITEHASTTT